MDSRSTPTLPTFFPLNLGGELGHACFRFAGTMLFIAYLAATHVLHAIPDLRNVAIGVGAYLAFGLTWIGVVRLNLLIFEHRRWISILFDQVIFSFALYQAGETLAPAIWAPIVMAIGNGLRNGPSYAKFSAILGSLCVGTALWLSPRWHLSPALMQGIIFSILVLPWYTLVLSEQIARAKRDLQLRAAKFESASKTDALTGVANRTGFFSELQEVLDTISRTGTTSAVMLLDLDGFKAVNDVGGHSAGDAVLRKVAVQLQQCLRAADTVARIGGDEFGIILRDIQSNENACRIAQKMIDAMGAIPVPCPMELPLGASIGICMLPCPYGSNEVTILEIADTLMYQAKKAGKNQFKIEEAEPEPA